MSIQWTNRYLKLTSILAATATAAGIIWAVADYTEVRPVIVKEFNEQISVVQNNSHSILLIRFQFLKSKQKITQLLTFEELNEMCAIAQELGFTAGMPECFRYELNSRSAQ
jgi:hypothetical protein